MKEFTIKNNGKEYNILAKNMQDARYKAINFCDCSHEIIIRKKTILSKVYCWLIAPTRKNNPEVKNWHAIVFSLILLFAMTFEPVIDLIF